MKEDLVSGTAAPDTPGKYQAGNSGEAGDYLTALKISCPP